MSDNKFVKDYTGKLIRKSKARMIAGKYYEEGTSCFLISGQWYRINSPKVTYDHYKKQYVIKANHELINGIINSKEEKGSFSNNPFSVIVVKKSGTLLHCLNDKIAEEMGYRECLADGKFYEKGYPVDESFYTKKIIPQNERSADYNLESNKERKEELIAMYNNMDIKITPRAKRIASYIGNFSFGFEVEVINGYLPKRIRTKYAIKALKDGSLRHENGEGMEFVSMPMSGPKGVQVIIDVFKEFQKRCEVNSLCAFHIHYGNTRKDKLYVLSLYSLVRKLQTELKGYFPYSRFNSIKSDGKVYCNPLIDLGIDYKAILSSENEIEFKRNVVDQFGKIYSWMNNGHNLAEEFAPPKIVKEIKTIDGKKMFKESWLKNIYTTKQVNHAVTGEKWQKASRYFIINLLNLFFNSINTIELNTSSFL